MTNDDSYVWFHDYGQGIFQVDLAKLPPAASLKVWSTAHDAIVQKLVLPSWSNKDRWCVSGDGKLVALMQVFTSNPKKITMEVRNSSNFGQILYSAQKPIHSTSSVQTPYSFQFGPTNEWLYYGGFVLINDNDDDNTRDLRKGEFVSTENSYFLYRVPITLEGFADVSTRLVRTNDYAPGDYASQIAVSPDEQTVYFFGSSKNAIYRAPIQSPFADPIAERVTFGGQSVQDVDGDAQTAQFYSLSSLHVSKDNTHLVVLDGRKNKIKYVSTGHIQKPWSSQNCKPCPTHSSTQFSEPRPVKLGGSINDCICSASNTHLGETEVIVEVVNNAAGPAGQTTTLRTTTHDPSDIVVLPGRNKAFVKQETVLDLHELDLETGAYTVAISNLPYHHTGKYMCVSYDGSTVHAFDGYSASSSSAKWGSFTTKTPYLFVEDKSSLRTTLYSQRYDGNYMYGLVKGCVEMKGGNLIMLVDSSKEFLVKYDLTSKVLSPIVSEVGPVSIRLQSSGDLFKVSKDDKFGFQAYDNSWYVYDLCTESATFAFADDGYISLATDHTGRYMYALHYSYIDRIDTGSYNVTRLAGTDDRSTKDGSASDARFLDNEEVALSEDGQYLLITTNGEHGIRKVSVGTYAATMQTSHQCMANTCRAHASWRDGISAVESLDANCVCDAGYVRIEGACPFCAWSCVACEQGKYSNGSVGAQCLSCPYGTTLAGVPATSADDCKCETGYEYNASAGACTHCVDGKNTIEWGGACVDCAAGKSSKFEAGYLRYWPPLDAVPSAGGLHEGSCGSSCQIAGGANFPLIYNFQDGRRQEIYEINFYAGWSGTSSPSDLFNLSSPPLLGQILVSGTTSSDPTFDGYSRPHAIFKLPEAIQPKKLTLALCGSNIVSGDEMERTCTPDWQASQLEWKWYGSETGQDGSWAMLLSNVQSGGTRIDANDVVDTENFYQYFALLVTDFWNYGSVSFIVNAIQIQGVFKDRIAICTNCSAGTYQSQSGQSDCIPCPVGLYSNTAGQAVCKKCPPNHFSYSERSDKLGAKECRECTPETITYHSLQTEQCLCGPGVFLNQETQSCEACPVGKVSPTLDNLSPCQPCEFGKEASHDQSQCLCRDGFILDGQDCKLCSPGTEGDGQGGCRNCTAGEFSEHEWTWFDTRELAGSATVLCSDAQDHAGVPDCSHLDEITWAGDELPLTDFQYWETQNDQVAPAPVMRKKLVQQIQTAAGKITVVTEVLGGDYEALHGGHHTSPYDPLVGLNPLVLFDTHASQTEFAGAFNLHVYERGQFIGSETTNDHNNASFNETLSGPWIVLKFENPVYFSSFSLQSWCHCLNMECSEGSCTLDVDFWMKSSHQDVWHPATDGWAAEMFAVRLKSEPKANMIDNYIGHPDSERTESTVLYRLPIRNFYVAGRMRKHPRCAKPVACPSFPPWKWRRHALLVPIFTTPRTLTALSARKRVSMASSGC